MANFKFKVGDVVELNSGGPKMTVITVGEKLSAIFNNPDYSNPEDFEVTVSWIDEKKEPHTETYLEPMLKFHSPSN